MMKSVTALMKTFLRDQYLFRAVKSLRALHPDIRIIVADDGHLSNAKEAKLKGVGVERYIRLPYGSCSVTRGRNLLVDACQTKYCLIGDDDFLYSSDSHLERLLKLMEIADIAGGAVIQGGFLGHYEGFYHHTLEGVTFKDIDRTYARSYSGIRYSPADFVFNFFIAKTEALRRVRWDEQFHLSWEHEDFFLSAHKAGLKTVYCPDSVVVHRGLIADPLEYERIRHRDDSTVKKVMKRKWGLREDQLLHEYAPRVAGETASRLGRDAMSAAVVSQEKEERYANVCFTSGKDHAVVPMSHSLTKGKHYDLRFDIGPESADSVVENAKEYPFPADLLPETQDGYWLEVVVASEDFSPSRNRFDLFLPRNGPSWVCSCTPHSQHVCDKLGRAPYLYVPLTAPKELKWTGAARRKKSQPSRRQSAHATLRLGVYYQKNLVQSQLLTAEVTQLSHPGNGYRSRIDYTLAPGFRDVGDLPTRTLNILTNRNADGSHRMVINGRQDQAVTFNLSEGQMKDAISQVREALREIHIEGEPPNGVNRYDQNNAKSKDDFIDDLRRLAPFCWDLFTILFGDKPLQRRRLRDELSENRASIQISRVGGSNTVYPWAFVYDIPLESSRGNDPVPCRLLKDWGRSANLIKDSSSRCPYEKEHATNTLCPFGFWGFKHGIEVPPSMPDRVLPQQITVTNTPLQLVVGLSLDLDEKLKDAHLKAIKEQLVGSSIIVGNSLETIKKALEEPQLEVVYFYCHGGRQMRPNYRVSTPYLKVGSDEYIFASDLTAWDSDWNGSSKHWEITSPLIFMNACRSAELTPELLVNFVDAFAGVYAAGVVGTEVLVHQQLANEVALEFLKRFLSHQSVGRAIGEMRMHLLRKGNLFGLAYTPYCSSDLALTQ